MPDYDVYRNSNGEWVGKREGADRASLKSNTQQGAYNATRDLAARNGGGEIKVHGLNGEIRDKNTIAPAKDPRSTKG